MIIKVKAELAGRKWVLFDNVEELELDENIHTFTSESQLHYITEDNAATVNLVIPGIDLADISESNPLRVAVLSFKKQNKKYIVVLSSLVYICNDEGKTIDRIIIKS